MFIAIQLKDIECNMTIINTFCAIIILCVLLEGCPKKQIKADIVNNTQENYIVVNTSEVTSFPVINIKNANKEEIAEGVLEEFSIEQYVNDCIRLTNIAQICRQMGIEIAQHNGYFSANE
jgi:hypothetical protein